MTDQELDRLARELTAASDFLASDDFLASQRRLVALEDEARQVSDEYEAKISQIKREASEASERLNTEREKLAASLETAEAAVVKAQQALTAHVQANYLSGFAQPEPVQEDDTEADLADHTESYPEDEPDPEPDPEPTLNGWDEAASAKGTGGLGFGPDNAN